MEYLLLIYKEEKRFPEGCPPEEYGEYQAFGHAFARAIQSGKALLPTSAAATVRVSDGKRMVTDGPFSETKEQLGGLYVISASDLDEALSIAAKIPCARHGSIEVRPIMASLI